MDGVGALLPLLREASGIAEADAFEAVKAGETGMPDEFIWADRVTLFVNLLCHTRVTLLSQDSESDRQIQVAKTRYPRTYYSFQSQCLQSTCQGSQHAWLQYRAT